MWCHPLLGGPLPIVALFLLLPWPIALPASVFVAAGSAGALYAGVKALRQRSLTGPDSMIGLTGRAVTEIDPEGLVQVQGELWNAESPEEIATGQRVRVDAVNGLRVRVTGVRPWQGGAHETHT